MASAPTLPFVPVEEYLKSNYEPDREYVDGALVERNLGRLKHGHLQSLISAFFVVNGREHSLKIVTEQRIRVHDRRYRIPDLAVMPADRKEDQALTEPPLLVFEILSPEDQFAELRRKIEDYRAMGIANVCILDPYGEPTVFLVNEDGRLIESASKKIDFVLGANQVRLTIDFAELFAQLG
jgi:Uma2 family endonuclease